MRISMHSGPHEYRENSDTCGISQTRVFRGIYRVRASLMHLEVPPVLPSSSDSWSMHLATNASACALWNWGERGQEGEMFTGALAHRISCSQSLLLCSLFSPSAQTGISEA